MPIFTPEERIGTLIGKRYLMKAIVAEGGMSTLFRGVDERLKQTVAIKLLKTRDSENTSAAPRLLREAQTIRKLNHPNVVNIFDIGETEDGLPYLVMELLEGRSLAQELRERERISPKEALALLLPLIGALAKAHDVGIIHRDLKPSNLFLSKDEFGNVYPKLLDFGVAKVEGGTHHTRDGTVVGTPEYMAPEQAAGNDALPSVDVWAMGVVLYRALSGGLPFEAPTPMGVLMKIVNDTAPPLNEIAPDLGLRFCVAIDYALNSDLNVRYRDMPAFARALLSTAQAEGIELPEAPDPIGLPDWPRWLSGEIPGDHTTIDVEPVIKQDKQLSKDAAGVTLDHASQDTQLTPDAVTLEGKTNPTMESRQASKILISLLMIAAVIAITVGLSLFSDSNNKGKEAAPPPPLDTSPAVEVKPEHAIPKELSNPELPSLEPDNKTAQSVDSVGEQEKTEIQTESKMSVPLKKTVKKIKKKKNIGFKSSRKTRASFKTPLLKTANEDKKNTKETIKGQKRTEIFKNYDE